MSECNLNILTSQMNDRIKTFLSHVLIEQINKPVSGKEFVSIKIDYKTGIQINIVFKHCIDIFRYVIVIAEHIFVGLEYYFYTILFSGGFKRAIDNCSSMLKFTDLNLSVPDR